MYAVTIDQRGSRAGSDDVPTLLQTLSGVETHLGFERTVGDEVQGLLIRPEAVVDVVGVVASTQGWWIGLGIGDVDEPLPESVRASRGAALYAAREAVERAEREAAGVAVAAGGDRDADACTDVETVLQVLGRLMADRSPAGHEAVEALHRHHTQRAAAAELGISAQAMSERLGVARPGDEQRLRVLAARLLLRADQAAT